MAKKLYEESNIQNIANAIRQKNGTTTTYKISDMADAIKALDTSGGSSGTGGSLTGIIERTLTSIEDDVATSVGTYACYYYTALASINLPNVTTIGKYAFYKCATLSSVDLPKATEIGDSAFCDCSALTSIDLPSVTTIDDDAFYNSGLTTLNAPNLITIRDSAFYSCDFTELYLPKVTTMEYGAFRDNKQLVTVNLPSIQALPNYVFAYDNVLTTADLHNVGSLGIQAFAQTNLTTLILRKTDGVVTAGTNCLTETELIDGVGYIYVPAALVDSYKNASYWSQFSPRFRALEDYTVDGTTTGALDETKI